MAALTPAGAQERAARGARYLDRNQPGWRDMIDVTRLNMAQGWFRRKRRRACGCILSQIDSHHPEPTRRPNEGFYSLTADRLGLLNGDALTRNGFIANTSADYHLLDQAWKDLLA